jgi:dihydrofolate reductase
MTTGHIYIATSLDGFVARADDTLDWLERQPMPQEGGDMGFAAFMESVDGLVMGRGTFQTVLGFGVPWPYSKPVIVMSRSLTAGDVPDALKDKVELSALAPAELMAELDGRGWKRAYVDGGQLTQAFLREGLIEDMVLTTVPVLIGEGKRLFGPLGSDIDLTLVKSEVFDNGMVQTMWAIAA